MTGMELMTDLLPSAMAVSTAPGVCWTVVRYVPRQ
jgi:hypothetical protein